MNNPFSPLADIAASQIGTQEDARHTNSGAAIAKYQHDTNLSGQGWPWCAAFVDWCVHQFLLIPANAAICAVPLANRPRTAAAFGLRTWGQDNNCLIFHPSNKSGHGLTPAAGDLVVYTFSHCGIVSKSRSAQTFEAIEGNSNDDGSRDGYAVVRKTRSILSVLCFVRLPARGQRLS